MKMIEGIFGLSFIINYRYETTEDESPLENASSLVIHYTAPR